MNGQDLIQFHQSSGGGGGGQGAGARENRGQEGYRRERENLKKASFRYLLLL